MIQIEKRKLLSRFILQLQILKFRQWLGIWPNRLDPRPPPRTLGFPQKKKKCLFCILGFSKHIIFSWKSLIFFGDWWFLGDFWWFFGWDWGTPAILRQNPNIYGQFQGKLSFGQFEKKVGIGSDPRPLLGPNSQLLPKICFWGSPNIFLEMVNYIFDQSDIFFQIKHCYQLMMTMSVPSPFIYLWQKCVNK